MDGNQNGRRGIGCEERTVEIRRFDLLVISRVLKEYGLRPCLLLATQPCFYKESPSHQFLSRRGSCPDCPSRVCIWMSALVTAGSRAPLIIRLKPLSLAPLRCVFFCTERAVCCFCLHGFSRWLKIKQSTAHCNGRQHIEMVFNTNGGSRRLVSGRALHLAPLLEQMENSRDVTHRNSTGSQKQESTLRDRQAGKQISTVAVF